MATTKEDDASLKRLGGGRWQTRDERFTIEPQSGTWAVVDAEQTDDLGLPLVRGPFSSLTAAKEAIGLARTTEPAESRLPERAAQLRRQPAGKGPDATAQREGKALRRGTGKAAAATAAAKPAPEPPAEPRWLSELATDDRRRARRLIEALTDAGAPDPEGLARRDIVGGVAAAAAFAVARQLAALGEDATPARVVALLADGADKDFGVRWRLVDGDDRPITLDPKALRR
jgi:hypothetical protein